MIEFCWIKLTITMNRLILNSRTQQAHSCSYILRIIEINIRSICNLQINYTKFSPIYRVRKKKIITGASIKCPKLSPLYIPLIPRAFNVHKFKSTPPTKKKVPKIDAMSSENKINFKIHLISNPTNNLNLNNLRCDHWHVNRRG